MLYFDILDPIRVLPDADKGRLLLAILEYGKDGIVPDFDGMLALAWGFIRPKIDKDESEYNLSVLRRQYATVCRERKKKNEPEITFDEWVKTREDDKHHKTSMMTNDDQWYPTTSTTTTPSTTPSTTTAAATTTNDDPAAADREIKALQGELGKGVVHMSNEQMEDLLDRLGLDAYDYYVCKLANFIIKNNADVKNHYETILKWWREDRGIRKPDADELAAVQRMLREG